MSKVVDYALSRATIFFPERDSRFESLRAGCWYSCRLKSNPLDQIAQRIREGPLLLLKRCYQERRRLRVVTRHSHGVRGSSEGRDL